MLPVSNIGVSYVLLNNQNHFVLQQQKLCKCVVLFVLCKSSKRLLNIAKLNPGAPSRVLIKIYFKMEIINPEQITSASMLGPSTNRIYGDEHLGRPPGGARGTIGPNDGAGNPQVLGPGAPGATTTGSGPGTCSSEDRRLGRPSQDPRQAPKGRPRRGTK